MKTVCFKKNLQSSELSLNKDMDLIVQKALAKDTESALCNLSRFYKGSRAVSG